MKNSTKVIFGTIGLIAALGISVIFMLRSAFDIAESNRIQGNGEIITENRTQTGFEEISVKDDFKVVLKQGDFDIRVEAESNLIQYLKSDVKAGALRLYVEKGVSFRTKKDPVVYVTMPEVKRIVIMGNSEFGTEGILNAEHLEAQILGSGELNLDVKCNTMKTSVSGYGEVNLKGECNFFETSISGSGDIDAENLLSENANIRISGSGDVVVNTTDFLDISISGSGEVRYVGKPNSINKQISGSGDIRSL